MSSVMYILHKGTRPLLSETSEKVQARLSARFKFFYVRDIVAIKHIKIPLAVSKCKNASEIIIRFKIRQRLWRFKLMIRFGQLNKTKLPCVLIKRKWLNK